LRALTWNSRGYDRLIEKVLEFAKEGATKKNIVDKFGLSRSMMRRLTAELIDKDLLRYHEPISSFMTSAKGINYLRKLSSKRPHSHLFKASEISRENIMLNSTQTLGKILVAVDGSEYSRKAFHYACMLARNNGSPLKILNVIEGYVNIGYSISKQLEKTSNEILHKYENKAGSLGVASVSTRQSRGNPADEILKIANGEKVDTIVVGSRGLYSTLKDFVLGSTSYKLAHYSKCTVIIVKK
jgi:nucleotide-binding universal stress UspA family protein/predicted transcriptional regulator